MSKLVGVVAATRHESVNALLAAYPAERDPKILIRELARRTIAYAQSKGWSGPPFCPKMLASLLGIRCREVTHDIGGDGRILLYPDKRLWIEYRASRMLERQRFTIFHEIAHTLFPDFCRSLPLHDVATRSRFDPEREFEYLCDIGAAEMLLPFEEFRADLRKARLSFDAIHKLRRRYEASLDATTYRVVELSDNTAIAALFLTDGRGSFPGSGPLWVKYASHGILFRGFIRPGTPVPKSSIAVRCYRDGLDTTPLARETWWIYNKPRTWLVQAAKLPEVPERPDYPKVVALLLPSAYARHNELSHASR